MKRLAAPASIACHVMSFTAIALAAGTPAQAAEAQWHVQAGGISHHFQPTRAAGREWQEVHPGFGLERRVSNGDGWSWRATLGTMQDSRGFWGGYGGGAYLRSWQWGSQMETSLGLGAYAFYRSTSWKGNMALVPGLLPTASITFPAANMGLNFLFVPQISGYNKSMPSVLHAQLTLRFR